MPEMITKVFCDICEKEITSRHYENVKISNGESFPANRWRRHNEVCTECCNKIMDFIQKLEVEK